MLHRFLFFFLVTCTSVFADSIEQPWLGCVPSDRFEPLIELCAQSVNGYHDNLVPYLIARGVDDENIIEMLFQQDLFHFAHALSILFEQDSATILKHMLGDHYSLIEGYDTQIDHVGRELFGPISFYLPLLNQMAPQLGLINTRNLVFPSTQVVKVLQEHDPKLKGVTIARIYFQSIESGQKGCLELFQTAPQDGKSPQNIEATMQRISLLTATHSSSKQTPIDHLSIQLNSVEEVQSIHQRIHQLASATLKPYQKDISHNSGDGSTQTKALMRDSKNAPFNKIVEFVYYSK